MRRTPLLKLLILSLFLIGAPTPAFAGKGKMTAATPDVEHPTAGNHVHVSLGLHVAFPPSTERLDAIKGHMGKASRMICDATDGKVLITDVTIGHNGQSADDADIFWYGGKFLGRYKSEGSYFGAKNSRLRVDEGATFKVVAHELAHNLFGLRDSYNRQRDTNNGHPACGYGPAVEPPLTASNHSIMQDYNTICWHPVTGTMTDVYCNLDSHCTDVNSQLRCSEFSDTASELGRNAGWEGVKGDQALYPALDTGQQNPSGLAGEQLWLSLRLYNDLADPELADDWVNGKGWRQIDEDVQKSAKFASIEYADSLGDYGSGDELLSRHFIRLRIMYDSGTGRHLLQAFIDTQGNLANVNLNDPPNTHPAQAQVLEWRVTGTDPVTAISEVKTSETLELGFGNSIAGNPLHYPVETLQGLNPQSLELTITGGQLIDADGANGTADEYGHPLWNANDDVTLTVDFSDIVYRDELHDWSNGFKVIGGEFDPVTGYGSGTFVGRRAPAGQGQSADPVYMQLYKCTADQVDTRWNGSIQQFAESYTFEWWNKKGPGRQGIVENSAFHQGACEPGWLPGPTGSDANLLRFNLGKYWPAKYPDAFEPICVDLGAQATSAPPDVCKNLEPAYHGDVFTDVDTAVVLVDTSGSMGEKWQNINHNHTKSEWARKSVKAFGIVGEKASKKMNVTFMSFDTETTPPKGGLLTDDDTHPDQITSENLSDWADVPANGSTAIGDALQDAFDVLDPSNPGNAVFILTDGKSNDGSDPAQVAAGSDVPVFVAPIGTYDPDSTTFADMAGAGGGHLYSVQTADEIPANLFELRMDLRGEDGSLYEEAHLPAGGADAVYSIQVEPDADRLVVMLTPRHDSERDWFPVFTLSGPASETITQADATYTVIDDSLDSNGNPEPLYALIMVPQPTAGDWTLVLHGLPDFGGDLDEWNVMARAHIEHATFEAPRCRVTTSAHTVSDAATEITIHARTEYRGAVGQGATFDARVRRPDGTVVAVAMTQQPDGEAIGTFVDYSHDGIYRATVDCVVSDDAKYTGEFFDLDEPLEPSNVPSGFKRVGSDTFVVDAGLAIYDNGQTCQRNELDRDGDGVPDSCDTDSDNDGLPNSLEGIGDADGDFIGNSWDSDSDNDGVGDSQDWDHEDPTDYRRYAVGDVNGDGVEDLIYGEPDYDGSGRIVVKMAGEYSQAWTQDSYGVINASEAGDKFGAAVTVGDFDGDGYDDVVVGAPEEGWNSLIEAGAVNVLYGSSTGLTEVGDQFFRENLGGVKGVPENYDHFGARLTTGDFNCDGFDDLVIGVPDEDIGAQVDAGSVHIIYGSSGGLTSVTDQWYQGNSGVNGTSEADDGFGDSLLTADFNADSCADLVIGAPREDYGATTDVGNAYAMYGNAAGLTTTGDWMIIQGVVAGTPEANDYFAERMWATRRNQDAYDDLVIMVPGECGVTLKGFHYLNGGASGLSTVNQDWFCFETNHLEG